MTLQKNNKIALASLTAIVLGASSSSISVGNLSTLFDYPFRGGHSKEVKLNSELKVTDKELNLTKENAQNMNLKIDQKIEEYKLSNLSEIKIDLKLSEGVEVQEPTSRVKGVYSEVKREDTALTINSQSKSEVQKAMQKISIEESQAYRSASEKIKKYIYPTRRKRSIGTIKSTIEKLTTQEKRALKKYYEQFLYLNQKKDPLNTQLKTIDSNYEVGSKSLDLNEKNCVVCKEVVDAMSKINWEGEELSVFNRNKRAWKPTDKPPLESQVIATWGSTWDRSHPYNVFYREENKFKKAVQKIINTRKKYYEKVNSPGWRICGLTIRWVGAGCGYGQKGSMEKDIKDASAEIELEIGSQLLQWMKQLGDKSQITTV